MKKIRNTFFGERSLHAYVSLMKRTLVCRVHYQSLQRCTVTIDQNVHF